MSLFKNKKSKPMNPKFFSRNVIKDDNNIYNHTSPSYATYEALSSNVNADAFSFIINHNMPSGVYTIESNLIQQIPGTKEKLCEVRKCKIRITVNDAGGFKIDYID